MTLSFSVWPPEAWWLVERYERELRRLYGRIAGPVRDELVRYSTTVYEGDSSELVNDLLASLPAHSDDHLAGLPFGDGTDESASDSWPGHYRRCDWNPVHLIRQAEEDHCLACDTAGQGRDALLELVQRPDPWEQTIGLNRWPQERTPLFASQLGGRKIVKVAEEGCRIVTLHQDGTLTERDVSARGLGQTSWRGEWGCDSFGWLAVLIGEYRLIVGGQSDGLCTGLEVNSMQVGFPPVRLAVGIEDVDGEGLRAVKWVAANDGADKDRSQRGRAFRLTRTTPQPWTEPGLMDESDLFPGAWSERPSWPVVRQRGSDGPMRLLSTDSYGNRYVGELHTVEHDEDWPVGTLLGHEDGSEEHTAHFIAVMPTAFVRPPE